MTHTAAPCIAIDCRMLGMSGIGVYLENLVPEIIRRLPQYHFRLMGHVPKIRSLALPAGSSVTIRSCTAPIYSLQEQLLMPLAARGASLLWVPHYNIPLLARVPLLVTVHDVAHLVLPEVTRHALRHAYARILFEGVRKKAESIIAVSQFTADEFVHRVGKPRGALNVVHNGVDAAWFDAPAPREQGQEASAPPYFIAVGNLKAHKRIDLLCRAFAAVKERLPHNLVLVGKYEGFISGGQSMQELRALAPGRIHCTGDIDTPRLRESVRGATALVFPSSYEGFGLPPLEAMAAGIPVIAADIPPVREVCGEWAEYFPVDDVRALENQLIKASQHSAPDATLLASARHHASACTWARAGATIAQIIESLAAAD